MINDCNYISDPKNVVLEKGVIEILSFYEPKNEETNFITEIDKKIKQVHCKIDFSKKITDQKIINYFKNCKKVVQKDLEDISYNKVQIYRT